MKAVRASSLTAAALLLAALAGSHAGKSPRVEVNILHVNDVHNRFESATASATHCQRPDDDAGKCFGGYARIATVVKAARAKDPETLFLDAGDQFVGSPWDAIFKGNLTAMFQNMLQPDAMVLGNHEFDFRSATTARYVKQLNFPMLGACNIDLTRSTLLKGHVQKYVLKKVKGKTIAILGVTTTDTAVTSSPSDNERFIDPVVGLNGCLQLLYRKVRKVDAVIVLSHAGYDIDLQIAAEVAGIDLVIGGHSHYLLWTGPTPLKNATDPVSNDTFVTSDYPTYVNNIYDNKPVPVVTAYTASRYLGQLVLEVGGNKPSSVSGLPILLGGPGSSNNVPRDPEVDAAIQAYAAPINNYAFQIVGQSTVDMVQQYVRLNESNLGNFVCDALSEYMAAETDLGAVDACLFNGGGLRAAISKGNVTMAALTSVMPFGNQIAVVAVKGSGLIAALYNSISALGGTSGTGRFSQVSGLRFVVNATRAAASPSNPFASKDRLVYAKLLSSNGSEVDIDPCATYRVVTNDYMAAGGDNYLSFAASPKLLPNGSPVEYIVADYLTRNSPVSPALEGRIINCDYGSHPACTTPATIPTICSS